MEKHSTIARLEEASDYLKQAPIAATLLVRNDIMRIPAFQIEIKASALYSYSGYDYLVSTDTFNSGERELHIPDGATNIRFSIDAETTVGIIIRLENVLRLNYKKPCTEGYRVYGALSHFLCERIVD